MIRTKYAVVSNEGCAIVNVEEKLNVYTGGVEQHMECLFVDTSGVENGYAKIYTSGDKYTVIANKESEELVKQFQLID